MFSVTDMLELKKRLAVMPKREPQKLMLTWADKPVEFQAIAFNNPRDWWAKIGVLEVNLQLHGVLYSAWAEMYLAVEDRLADVQGYDTKQEALDALHGELLEVAVSIAEALA